MDKGYHQPGAWAVIYCATTGKFLMGKRSAKVNKAGAWDLFGGRVPLTVFEASLAAHAD